MYQSQNKLYACFDGLGEGYWCQDSPDKEEILEGIFTRFNASEEKSLKKISFLMS